jgi:hypothetical protein
MDLFPREFVPQLSTKNMGNSPSFPTITHTTLSSKRFRCYGISMINAAAEFYSGQNSGRTDLQFSVSDWPKLWKSQILFQTTTLSAFWWSIKWLQMVSNLWVTAVRNSTFLFQIGFWWISAMTSLETSYTKNVVNELSFLLVTHTTHFDIRFGRYGFLKPSYSVELIPDRLM